MGKGRRVPPVLLAYVLGASTAALGQAPPAALKVAFRAAAGVFVQQGEDGLTGFDVDLFHEFLAWRGKRAGGRPAVEISLVDSVQRLLETARDGACDLAIGSITITAERDRVVDFSRPYLPVRMVLFGATGRVPEGPYREVMAGRVVGALAGSTGATRAEELAREVQRLTVKADYTDYELMFADLLRDPPAIDAVVSDITHYWVLSLTKGVTLIAPMSQEQGLGFVFPEGSPWKAEVDAFLEEYVDSNEYYELMYRYFGGESTPDRPQGR